MAKINPEIFRLFDIRGTYPDQIDGQAAFAIARSFMRFLKKELGKEDLVICVSKDARISSPELFDGFVRGVGVEGGKVIDIGLAMTPAVYFAVPYYDYDGGVNITASHNPNPYNGLKLLRKGGLPIGGKTGLLEVQKHAEEFMDQSYRGIPLPEIEKKNVIPDYVAENLSIANIEPDSLNNINIAVDAANGTSGAFIDALLEKFPGISYTRLYFEPDGNFPNHGPDPIVPKNLEDLAKVVKRGGYAYGIAFDGDGDRIMFLDEKGEIVGGGGALGLVVPMLLRDHPGAKILYPINVSRAIPELIESLGGKHSVTRVGQAFIKPQMQRENAFFAGEYSGHYTIGEGRFYEVPFVVLLLVLREIVESGKKMSDLVSAVEKKWHHSGEINFKVQDKDVILQKIRDAFSNGTLNDIDGIRVDYSDWWFIVRPSNTEPLLRLVVEADSTEKLQEKVDLLTSIINGE